MFVFISSILVFSIFAFWWGYFQWTNRHFIRLASKIRGPPAYPLIGSTLEFVGTPIQIMDKFIKLSSDYGTEPFKIWLGPFLLVVISKPEDIQVILKSSKALKKPYFYEFFKDYGEGLGTAPVHKWKKHRQYITPVFNTKLLEQFLPIFNQTNETLVENLKQELDKTTPFNLWHYIFSTTLETICKTAMGYNINTQTNAGSEFENLIIKLQNTYVKRTMSPWLYPNIINSIYERLTGINKLRDTAHKFPLEIIMKKKQAFALRKTANKVKDENDRDEKNVKMFLDLLLELSNAGANFSDNDLKDEVITMMLAGSETTAITSCFCLLMLAIHQDVQDQVYDEIYDVLGNEDKPILIEDVNKLPFLEQVLMETLRLYPVLPVVFRELEDDVKIISGDLILPKGTIVSLSSYSTHYSCDLYSNPSTFNPENFNQENIAKRHKNSFMAFSGGARNCIGSKYAMLSMKVFMCKFLHNFSVHTDVKQISDIQLSYGMLIRSANGYPVTIRSRDRRPTFKREKKNSSINN